MNPYEPTRPVYRVMAPVEELPYVRGFDEQPKQYLHYFAGNTDDPGGVQIRLNRMLAEGWKVLTYWNGPPGEPSVNVPGVSSIWFMLERLPAEPQYEEEPPKRGLRRMWGPSPPIIEPPYRKED